MIRRCRHTWAQMARAMRQGYRHDRYGWCPACAWEFDLSRNAPKWARSAP